MKTKGALIWEFNQPWSIEEIEIGDPVKDEVKIQMEASGMCHSDHHLVTGGIPMGGFPVLGGHEGAGIVTEVGPGVEDIAPGDHVVLSFIPSCGTVRHVRPVCATCATWARACSAARPSPTAPSASRPRASRLPDDACSARSRPYMVVHKSSVVKIDPSIPFEVAKTATVRRAAGVSRARRLSVSTSQGSSPPTPTSSSAAAGCTCARGSW